MTTIVGIKQDGFNTRFLMLVAPLAAMIYPFLLQGYSLGVRLITSGGAHAGVLPWLMAAVFLIAAFAVPGVALVFAIRLSMIATATAAVLQARRAALLAVATPVIFTFVGVVLYMLGYPDFDKWVLAAFWAAVLTAVISKGNDTAVAAPSRSASISFHLRKAHMAAAVIVVLFLLMHIGNQLAGLAGPDLHTVVMKALRHVYRSTFVEPVLVGLFLFLVVSGFYLFLRATAKPSDRFQTFQIASGVYLALFVLSHMNAVFIFARTYLRVDTGWAFATGAPVGLLKDPWNIRLVPLYVLAVFFVLSHFASGMRVVMLKRGMNMNQANRLMIAGTALGGVVAVLIVLGMCGLRL
ncbi:MAG: hypothetical protein HQK89_07030 [Nitrospirae bacterium]|nr:hypothetical protein [Nitrospirota bacterium]